MSVNLEWDDAWAFCHSTTKENRDDFLRQVDWIAFIRGISANYQIEVLKNAPEDVVDYVKNELLLDARLALKLDKTVPKKKTPKKNVSFRIVMG